MRLSLWTYEGPPHVGAMRIAASMTDVHYLLHAPQGDTYADLLFTMIERRDSRPPVSYTTFQARDLGGDTAALVKRALADTCARFKPAVLLVGESCTAELIQDQPGTLAQGMDLPVPVIPLELPSYSRKENWGASETFYHLVRALAGRAPSPEPTDERTDRPRTERARTGRWRANLLGPSALGFRCRDDVREVGALLEASGVDVAVVAPLSASAADLARLPEADFNVCLYPEVAETACRWLEKTHGQPTVWTVPIGVGATRAFLADVAAITGQPMAAADASRLPWYSRSVDSTYLSGKRVFLFGDATHVCAAARIATGELGFDVVGIGSYAREQARQVRACAAELGLDALITDDYREVEQRITELAPELVLGTQMERHIAKRLGIPCAVISAPFHVQDCPARYSPQMGWEGANVIFDTWVHPLTMGLEEHLLHMFRDDFEFNDTVPSHLAAEQTAVAGTPGGVPVPMTGEATGPGLPADHDPWTEDARRELRKIPFFVRGKARNNTEQFARDRGLATITVETLYDAKAHFGR